MWVVGSAKLSEIKNSTPGIGLNFWNPLGLSAVSVHIQVRLTILETQFHPHKI